MNHQHEDEFIDKVRQKLNDEIGPLPAETQSQLRRSRATAIAQATAKSRSNNSILVPAMSFVVTLVVVGALLRGDYRDMDDDVLVTEMVAQIEFDTLDVEEFEIEIIEDLEFYQWLEANGYAG